MKAKIFPLLVILQLFSRITEAQIDLKQYVNTQPPNIASFEKYGNIPISYNSGQISALIPLYTFQVDDIVSIPIELSYNNTGMKPDDVPTWVGHGFDLLPGGYITQDIRGISDLTTAGGLCSPTYKALLQSFMNSGMNDSAKYYYAKNVLSGNYDSQQDIFSLNLLGRMTKFYYDGTEVKFLHYMPWKVTYDGGDFIVIDEKGYKYVFSEKVSGSGSASNPTEEYPALGGTTTWALSEIITPSNETVEFDYQTESVYNVNNTTKSYTYGAHFIDENFINCYTEGYVGYNTTTSTSYIVQSILKKILYKGRAIEFNTIARNDLSSLNALSNIKVRNEAYKLIKEIDFSYTNGQRLRLDSLMVKDSAASQTMMKYSFDYYKYNSGKELTSIPLPTSSSRTYAIDHWGYYNGVTSNTFSGVPKADYSKFISGISFTGDNDRSANGEASRIGMLQKITYPTGGYTEFQWEPNQMVFRTTGINEYLRPAASGYTETILNKSITCFDATGGSYTGTFTVNQSGYVNYSYSMATEDDNSAIASITVNATGSTTNLISKAGRTESGSSSVYLAAGTYQYSLYAGCTFAEEGDPNMVSLMITENITPDSVTVPIGGNRILRVRDVDQFANVKSTRRFEYLSPELNLTPDYITSANLIAISKFGEISYVCGPEYTIGGNNIISYDGYHINYRKVNEYFSENGENGKKEYLFSPQAYYTSGSTVTPYPPGTNLTWRSSGTHQVTTYKNTGSAFAIVQQENTTYTASYPYYSPQISAGVKFGLIGNIVTGTEKPKDYSNFFNSALSYVLEDKYDKEQTTTTEYPTYGTDAAVTVIDYTYSDDYFLPTVTTTTASDGETVEDHAWYPQDYDNTVSNVATLKSNNMVGLPVKKIHTKNGNMVSGEVIAYNDKGDVSKYYQYENNALLALYTHDPATYIPAKFNIKTTLSYTDNGRVREFLKTDGAPVTILWGYNESYPVAEITNATYEEVLNVLGQTTINTLAGSNPGTDAAVRTMLQVLRTSSSLQNANISTYTYNPLVGMTSSTDMKNYTSYYEYDNIGRLIRIKDNNGNILKQYQYNYAGN